MTQYNSMKLFIKIPNLPNPIPCALAHGSSTSVLLEPRSLKTFFAVSVSCCLPPDRSQFSKGLFSLILFPGIQTQCRHSSSPRNLAGHDATCLRKGSEFKGRYGMQGGYILQCRKDVVGACGEAGRQLLQDCSLLVQVLWLRKWMCT